MPTLAHNSYTLTKKGQVTIPLSIRKKYGLENGDKIFFEEGKNEIKIKPANESFESVYQSVKPLKKRLSLAQIRKIALEDKLDAVR
jgi:AbrB family looped-hinge helix DNA binding protein